MGSKKILVIVSILLFSLPVIAPNRLLASILPMPQIAAGGHHTITLKPIGTVWTWGDNWNGQMGSDSAITQNTPVHADGLSNIIGIAGGYLHSAGLGLDGTVWTWGNNAYGQPGNGTYERMNVPVQIEDFNLAQTMSKIYGYVESNGQYVDTVKLKIRGEGTKTSETTYSDVNGYFEFSGLNADSYTIKSKKKGYKDAKYKVIIEEGETKEVGVTIQAKRRNTNTVTYS